jgi:hypothetical protein
MLKRVGRPSPAMIVAMVALFVALGGTSYALTKKDKKKIRNIATAVTSTKVFGATSTDAGTISAATLRGTTVSRTGNNYRYTFPRSVAGCVPVGSGSANGTVATVISTAAPNSVDVGPNGGGGNSVIVVCP